MNNWLQRDFKKKIGFWNDCKFFTHKYVLKRQNNYERWRTNSAVFGLAKITIRQPPNTRKSFKHFAPFSGGNLMTREYKTQFLNMLYSKYNAHLHLKKFNFEMSFKLISTHKQFMLSRWKCTKTFKFLLALGSYGTNCTDVWSQ